MKKIIALTIFALVIGTTSWAQRGEMQERIKAQKVAFITERLELTPEEAQNFWPIYNAFDDKTSKLRNEDLRAIRKEIRKGDLSEAKAQELLTKMMTIDDQIHTAKKNLVSDLKDVISAEKIIRLKAAEDSFNKMLLQKLKEMRENRKKNQP